MNDNQVNKKKIVVGILAVFSTIVAVIAWILKLKYGKRISFALLGIISGIAICFWIWYANLPSFSDADKPISQIEEIWGSVTKGELK